MAKSVGRDIHKMHAFVRFRELLETGLRRRFAAWFEPEHRFCRKIFTSAELCERQCA
ncbi:DUF4130 domain-containing protein [Ochrobactrum sp. POC9]|uniref:DUF4130 domain-containing protein n=1 Tax=Ochrobactrum sp. POC9 TaxID=2203419 RepID=UPI00257039F3|nr:DUF4130 domain-containing protein [Ochrobactrum sp. POC9]